MKFKCESGHLITVDIADEYYKEGPISIKCNGSPNCPKKYEILKKMGNII